MGSPLLLCAVHRFDRAQSWLAEAGERLGDTPPWGTQTVVSTSVAHGLVSLAEEVAASMVVLGSSRYGPLGRLLAGSTVRRVAHGAPCAVAVAPHEWRLRSSDTSLTIGAGITDSPESHDALAFGAQLAAAAHAPLRVLTAVGLDPAGDGLFAAAGTSSAAWCAERRTYSKRVARAAVDQVASSTSAEAHVMNGDPVECLADASRDVDFLVVGSRRYGPLRTALLGSVSSALIDRASCPVIIVPRGTDPGSRSAAFVAEAAPV
jgi:nucleotide-binding universal stress UspA family protein